MEKPEPERYQHKFKSYDSAVNHNGTIDPIAWNRSNSSQYYFHSRFVEENTTDNIRVPNLQPFHMYAFHVYACNSVSHCSDYFFHSHRTKPSPDADDITFEVFQDDHTGMLKVVVTPPNSPNSVTVSYEIESHDETREKIGVRCITRQEMHEMNYT